MVDFWLTAWALVALFIVVPPLFWIGLRLWKSRSHNSLDALCVKNTGAVGSMHYGQCQPCARERDAHS